MGLTQMMRIQLSVLDTGLPAIVSDWKCVSKRRRLKWPRSSHSLQRVYSTTAHHVQTDAHNVQQRKAYTHTHTQWVKYVPLPHPKNRTSWRIDNIPPVAVRKTTSTNLFVFTLWPLFACVAPLCCEASLRQGRHCVHHFYIPHAAHTHHIYVRARTEQGINISVIQPVTNHSFFFGFVLFYFIQHRLLFGRLSRPCEYAHVQWTIALIP